MKQALLLFFFLVTISAQAQSDFRAGYVLPLSGDTLRGQVDYRGNTRNSRVCQFRSAASAPTTEYTPEQLRGYGISGGQQFLTTELPGKVPAKVFMQILVQGGLSIFHYTDADDKVFFFARKGAEALQPLVQRDTTISEYNKATRLETATRQRQYLYRNVLWSRMADCPAVQTTLPKVALVESQLIKVGLAYNKCVGSSQYAAAKPVTHYRYALLGGVYQSTVLSTDQAENEQVASSTRPTYGIGVEISPSSFSPRMTLLVQLLYLDQQYDKTYLAASTGGSSVMQIKRTVHIETTTFRVPLLARYAFGNRSIRPYLQAGAVPVFNVKRKAYRSDASALGPSCQDVPLRSYGFGVTAGAGVAFALGAHHGALIEVRADQLDNTSKSGRALVGMRGVTLLAGYTFGK
ncbi:outer membrane beta-barrel protein [Hymenobacter algoricola]|uniref:Outer membrane protein beta-barrel domain-containing protein n=1 Tax=Hymenobacter algoricola TaxID=486267 RepID=A0ABP7NK22_9BACT